MKHLQGAREKDFTLIEVLVDALFYINDGRLRAGNVDGADRVPSQW